jgi:hypothetical protein
MEQAGEGPLKLLHARREALRVLVAYVHWEATVHAQGAPEVAAELRRLGDKISDLANRGTAAVLANFFGALG